MKTNKGLFILFASSLLTLASCGGDSGSGELSKYQKVAKAFKAVTRTLDLKSSSSSRSLMPSRAIDIHGDMSDFESYFATAHTDEKIEDQIDLDSPPLIQFQYLKIIYETIGSNYSFGTKYSHTVTGDVYIDFETGYKDKEQSEDNKYHFAFDFSVCINIDEDDLITSDVGMDITLTHGQNTYKYYKYASLILDYDFTQNSDDNYELALYDYGQDKDLTYLHCDYGYEYDYCLVSNSKLKEWRKFRYEADRKMFKDASHPTLDSYIDEGAVITTSNQRWYKNNVLKTINSNDSESMLVIKELYKSFGLSNTDLDPDGYFAKSSTDTSAIQTIYDKASREYGDGLIYHIIAEEEEDDPSERGWPVDDIIYVTGMDSIAFSERDAVTYDHRREDVDGESNSVIITVHGATADEYQSFENVLVDVHHFSRGEDAGGYHSFVIVSPDNRSFVAVYVSASDNTIIFYHYFGGGGGGQGQYDPITLEGMFTYDLPYNYYSLNNYNEKDMLNDLAGLLDDQNIYKIFSDKFDLTISKNVQIALSEKDIENVGDSKNLKEARDNVMNMYGNYYAEQWNPTNIQNGFINSEYKDLVILRQGEDDGTFFIYFFRCIDDTMQKYLEGSISTGIEIEIWTHYESGFNELTDTLSIEEGESVLPYLDPDAKYYLDGDLTILLTDENCYAYDGMVLHKKDYEDPEYEKISVPGGIDYEDPYTWKNSNPLTSEEEIYNRVMNMVDDSWIRPYLEGNVSTKDESNAYYQISIGPEIAEYLGVGSFVDAANVLYSTYTRKYDYAGWNVGTKGNYFYLTEGKEEDVVFFDMKHLEEGMIEFIHLHLTSPVMAKYEAGEDIGGGGGETPVTTLVVVFVYKDGMIDETFTLDCPVGQSVIPYLGDYYANYAYLDGSFDTPLNEYNSVVDKGMVIYVNFTSSGPEEEHTTIRLIVDGDTEYPNIYEIDAVIGEDVYPYIAPYADEFYYEAEYINELHEGECSVGYDMVIYGRTTK